MFAPTLCKVGLYAIIACDIWNKYIYKYKYIFTYISADMDLLEWAQWSQRTRKYMTHYSKVWRDV